MAKTTYSGGNSYIKEYKDGTRATFTKPASGKGRAKMTGGTRFPKPKKK